MEVVEAEDLSFSSTWIGRLILNLYSYSIVLGTVAFIVIVTKYKLWPPSIQTSVIMQWFVYGKQGRTSQNHDQVADDGGLLLVDKGNKRAIEVNSTYVFIWCFVGLQFSYLIWGILQEKIMTTEYPVTNQIWLSMSKRDNQTAQISNKQTASSSTISFHDSQFLVFINRIIAFILSIFALVYNRPKRQIYSHRTQNETDDAHRPQAPLYEYIYCSLSNILSSWCQYEALKYVNFPTQVLSKSCKIIPVMLMSRIMLKKRYQSFDYICALFLSVGMFIFLLNQPTSSIHKKELSSQNLNYEIISPEPDTKTNHYKQLGHQFISKNSSLISGLLILALYLAFDSFTSNWQQSLFGRYGITNWQMMAATNFYSIMLTLTSLHHLNTLEPAFKLMVSSRPLLFDCLFMSVMSSIGQLFVYYTIKRFGSVVFAVIMTMRQFLAILLSCMIYGHELTLGSTAGLLLVFFVIGYQIWSKSSKTPAKKAVQKEDSARMPFSAAVR